MERASVTCADIFVTCAGAVVGRGKLHFTLPSFHTPTVASRRLDRRVHHLTLPPCLGTQSANAGAPSTNVFHYAAHVPSRASWAMDPPIKSAGAGLEGQALMERELRSTYAPASNLHPKPRRRCAPIRSLALAAF